MDGKGRTISVLKVDTAPPHHHNPFELDNSNSMHACITLLWYKQCATYQLLARATVLTFSSLIARNRVASVGNSRFKHDIYSTTLVSTS